MSKAATKVKSAPVIMSAILVLTLFVSVIFIIKGTGKNDAYITIRSGGEVVWTGSLTGIQGEIVLTVVPASGDEKPAVIEGIVTSYEHYNVISITPDGVSVTESDCKNRICIHQGVMTSGDLPIACLPNKLLITISSDEGNGADAYTY
jgi:hypothetical protein